MAGKYRQNETGTDVCREKESSAVEKKVSPWKRKLCRGKESFAVRNKVLPWKRKFCREK